MKKSAFSLIELGVVVLIIGVVTLVALNGKSLIKKAGCVATSLSSKTVTGLSADNVNTNLSQVGPIFIIHHNAMVLATQQKDALIQLLAVSGFQ